MAVTIVSRPERPSSVPFEGRPLPVARVAPADLRDALVLGARDFWAMPSHLLFLGLIYPLAGIVLARLALGYDVIHLVFPLVAGFALVGPFVAIGLYEISRRREMGLPTRWSDALEVLRAPGIASILVLGVLLTVLFGAWLLTANVLYRGLFGDAVPTSVGAFLTEVLTTGHGWALILAGHAFGFVFALAVLMTSAVSFPLILDRGVDVVTAVRTSIAVVMASPAVMLAWGAIVAAGLMLGTLMLFVGLAIIVPILGHATWHLYRRAVPRPAALPQ
jgi:uncharacterized membrane protein